MGCIIFVTTIRAMDDVLPLIFELKKAGIVSRIVFIARNRKTYEFIKKNSVLYDAMYFVGGRFTFINKYNNRYFNCLYNIFVLRRYLYKKIITIETYDATKDQIISLLLAFNHKIFHGKRIKSLIINALYRLVKSVPVYRRAVSGDYEVKEIIIKGYDGILLASTIEEWNEAYNEKLITDVKLIQVGYTRGLKEWQHYLHGVTDRYMPEVVSTTYIFIPLTYLTNWLTGEDNMSPATLLKESLSVLKEFNNDVLTVFKPNHNTDMDKFQEILKTTDYKNYIISYIHPLLLIKGAKFTFTYTPTSIVIDAYYNGCTTVEYAHYDSRFYKLNDGQSVYHSCVDFFIHRDVVKLKRVLSELIYNDIPVLRDQNRINEDFPILTQKEIKDKFGWLCSK
tara:strand:- start:99 stop:1280 length:1182 start_codon:yes stop_codon:yes gene_type:complete